jgi:hypothetical protein
MARSPRGRVAIDAIAARIHAVLASRGVTLHQISVASRRMYGSNSPSRIPHTLYHSLRHSANLSPSLAQICALSRITDYRIHDWLTVLGIDLGRIAGLQVTLPAKRTRLIDPSFREINLLTSSLQAPQGNVRTQRVLPFGQMLGSSNRGSEWRSELVPSDHHSLFAKIGREDAYAFPELLPGSIVRLTPASAVADLAGRDRPPLLLIENERGLWCGRFRVSESGTIIASSPKLAYAPIAFRSPQEAKILGVVDMEIRWIHRFESPVVPKEFAAWRKPLELTPTTLHLGTLLRRARARAGLTLREASQLAQRISSDLSDEQYAIAQSTLSDCEASDTPPRHLEKVITLFLIYGLRLDDMVAASGTAFDQLGRDPIPANLIPEPSESRQWTTEGRSREVPVSDASSLLSSDLGIALWLLDGSLAEASGISRSSLRDLFWLGGDQPFLPAGSGGALLALVDRRKKKPTRVPGRSTWQQPAWVLLLRDGAYRCACCSLQGGNLVLYPESDRARAPEHLRFRRDVEVIGQVVGLARRVD